MQIGPPTIWETVQRLAVIMIALWWGGLNCLTGCLFAPSDDVAAMSHCSMSAEGDCCLSQADSEDESVGDAIGSVSVKQSLSCCSLEAFSAEVKHNLRGLDVVVAPQVSSRINFAPESKPRVGHLDRWARLPDRGGTHLLHCVFLI
jgi:hypothetical protein